MMETDPFHGLEPQLRRAPPRRRYLWLHKDAVMQPAIYNCGHHKCPQRLLIGIKNSGHIRFAIPTIEALGWRFHKATQQFFCEGHKHEIQTLVPTTLPQFHFLIDEV